jgi:chromosome segregation ATPase
MSKSFQFLLLLFLAIVGVLVSQEVYRWAAFGEERRLVGELREELLDAGAALVRAQTEMDSLRGAIVDADARLEREQRALQEYNRHARHGRLPQHLYDAYRTDLAAYNDHVVERNARVSEMEAIRQREHVAVARYNALSERIHGLAVRLGQPYYSVPTPLEAAMERSARVRAD